MVIPIAQHKEGVLDKANELLDTLKAAGYKAKIDDSDKAPGWKFSGQEILGIPTRIEIGPKDIENNQAVIVRRDTREKIVVSLDEITTKLAEVLETMQKDMFEKAKTFLEAHINTATTMDEMNEKFNENLGFIKAMWWVMKRVKKRSKHRQAEQLPDVSRRKKNSFPMYVSAVASLQSTWYTGAKHIKIKSLEAEKSGNYFCRKRIVRRTCRKVDFAQENNRGHFLKRRECTLLFFMPKMRKSLDFRR